MLRRRQQQSMQASEEFYAVKWSMDRRDGRPVLIAAGKLGMARILDCHSQALIWVRSAKVEGGFQRRKELKSFMWLARPCKCIAWHTSPTFSGHYAGSEVSVWISVLAMLPSSLPDTSM